MHTTVTTVRSVAVRAARAAVSTRCRCHKEDAFHTASKTAATAQVDAHENQSVKKMHRRVQFVH